MTQAIPEGFQTVTPMLMFRDVRNATEFCKRAIGAEDLMIMPGPDGKRT